MNVERLTELAEWLEAGAPHRNRVVGFQMFELRAQTDCGTACCIAGAACEFFGNCEDVRKTGDGSDAEKLLGLTAGQGFQLFCPFMDIDYQKINPAWAARTIRHLIATGEVDWAAARSAS